MGSLEVAAEIVRVGREGRGCVGCSGEPVLEDDGDGLGSGLELLELSMVVEGAGEDKGEGGSGIVPSIAERMTRFVGRRPRARRIISALGRYSPSLSSPSSSSQDARFAFLPVTRAGRATEWRRCLVRPALFPGGMDSKRRDDEGAANFPRTGTATSGRSSHSKTGGSIGGDGFQERRESCSINKPFMSSGSGSESSSSAQSSPIWTS
jgi:hypothetical protein